MHRRQVLGALSAAALMSQESHSESASAAWLEVRFWRLHNTPEKQGARVAEYLEHGLTPALARSGANLAGAFSIVIGPDSPCYVTLTQYSSLAVMQETVTKLKADTEHSQSLEQLNSGSGLPFVRVESSLLRSFDVMPQPTILESSGKPARTFELRTYEAQTFSTLTRKVGMFNHAEAGIFERLGFRPVFFGETIVGPRQPNLMYMLSYDDLAAHDRLWKSFISDPEWKKLSTQPELTDPQIVANINNVILAPLSFSPIR